MQVLVSYTPLDLLEIEIQLSVQTQGCISLLSFVGLRFLEKDFKLANSIIFTNSHRDRSH